MRVRNNYRQLGGVLALCVATAFCGGSSPTSPSSASGGSGSGSTPTGGTGSAGGGTTTSTSCRTGIATYRIVTTGGGFTSTTTGSCTFNSGAVEGTCTNSYTDTLGSAFTSVSTTRHASRGDVVDEVAVIPPLNRSLGTTTTVSGAGLNSTNTATNTYDGQRRLVMTTAVSQTAGLPSVTSTTTYTTWDSAGRPTAGSTVAGGVTTPVSYAYDNATRTQTQTSGGTSCTQTFDTNGNPLVGNCAGAVATFTTLTTQQVCR